MSECVMDLWQDPIEIARPYAPRRHMPTHACAAPEVEFGNFGTPRYPGPPGPDFLDHIVLMDTEENYTKDHFVANFTGRRGYAHPVGNLMIHWKTRDFSGRGAGCFAEIKMRT